MNVRLWSRDELVLRELQRAPMLARQVSLLCGFPPKRGSERLLLLERAGLLKSCPFFQAGRQGRSQKLFYRGSRPSLLLSRHMTLTVDLRVQAGVSFPDASFFYGDEINAGKLRPDAALVAPRGERTALVFFEVDCGTERLTSPSAYSLVGKLRSYAAYFDSAEYRKDFSWAGSFTGFRVGVVLTSSGRLVNLQRLLAAEGLDFVLLATVDDLKAGIAARVWRSFDDRVVDIFGRE